MVQSGRISATVIQNVLGIIKTCWGRYTSDWLPYFPMFPYICASGRRRESNFAQCTGCSRKKYPLKIFGNISPTTENFKLKFTRFCMFISTQNYKNFIQLFLTFSAIIFWYILCFTRKKRKIAISLHQYDLSPQNVVRWCRTYLSGASPVKI